MATAIRLSRAGSKKRPYYRIVIADSRSPRDGRYIERVGSYNPMLPKDSDERVILKTDEIKAWLEKGAQPTDRVSRFLEKAGMIEAKTRNNAQKGALGKNALARVEEKKEKEAAAAEAAAEAAEAAKAAAAAPAEEAPAEAPAEGGEE